MVTKGTKHLPPRFFDSPEGLKVRAELESGKKTYEEVARQLGLKPVSLRASIFRARQRERKGRTPQMTPVAARFQRIMDLVMEIVGESVAVNISQQLADKDRTIQAQQADLEALRAENEQLRAQSGSLEAKLQTEIRKRVGEVAGVVHAE